MPIKALLFDLGDTIMIEETEEKDGTQTTLRADLFPGMAQALHRLRAKGLKLALVADTRPGTYRNVLRQHGLFELFDAFAISEELGTEKPDRRMFEHAMRALGVRPEECVMFGNNLERDIAGANALGILTVFTLWNRRRRTTPETPLENPAYICRSAAEILALAEALLHA